MRRSDTASFFYHYLTHTILIAKNLIHQHPNPVYIFISYLHKNRSGLGEKLARNCQPITKISQV